MRTAGRPASPTIHPRTKPEAEEFATKNRGTNDWFRHDGKNVDSPPTVVPKVPTEVAKEAAAKNKGEPGEWFKHDEGGNPTTVNGQAEVGKPKTNKVKGPRCRGEDALKIHDKVYGKEETWYKFEENQNYVEPRPKSRLGTAGAEDSKAKTAGKGDESRWYKHEHKNDNYTPPAPKSRTPSKQGTEIKQRMEAKGTPDWFVYEHKKQNGAPNGDTPAAMRPNRLMSPDAEEYLERNKKGSASDWFSHEHKNGDIKSPEYCASPRLRTPEGQANARKFVGESGDWFNHDANRYYTNPATPERCPSAAAKLSKKQNSGSQMQSLLMSPTNGVANGHDTTDGRIKPEAKAYAQKSVQGMMAKLLDQEGNKDYSSPRSGPRIKPEAAANAAKNRGMMQDSMEGYLDTPRKRGVRRVKPEAEGVAHKNKGSMDQLIGNYGNLTPSARTNSKAVHGDGVQIAQKGKNSEMQNLIGSYGQLEISGRPVPRLQSSEAHANARKWQGEAGSVIYGN